VKPRDAEEILDRESGACPEQPVQVHAALGAGGGAGAGDERSYQRASSYRACSARASPTRLSARETAVSSALALNSSPDTMMSVRPSRSCARRSWSTWPGGPGWPCSMTRRIATSNCS
jgi:hypothetical protein